MSDPLEFRDAAAFRAWLVENGASSDGVWLLFGKRGGPVTLSAAEALEEALCAGWIDGQMRSIDDLSYRKYFAARRVGSRWSEKNKGLVARLEEQGRMTEAGHRQVEAARASGAWDAPKAPTITEEDVAAVAEVLREHEVAHTNFQAMSPSVRRTYTRAYLDAKTDAGRAKRVAWMVDRLDRNLKPM